LAHNQGKAEAMALPALMAKSGSANL